MFTKMKNWLISWNIMPILWPTREDGFFVIAALAVAAAAKAYGKYKNAKSKEEAIAAEAELQNTWAEADEDARKAILSEIGGGDPKVGMSNLMNMKSTTESIRNDQSTSTTNYSENKLTSPEWAGANKDMQGNVNVLKALDRARLAQSDTSLAGEMTARTIREVNEAARAAQPAYDSRAGGLGLSGGAPGSLNPDIEAARVKGALNAVGNEQQLARQIGFENQDRSMALAEMLKATRQRTKGTSTTDQFGTSTMSSSTLNPLANIQAAYALTAPQPRTTTKSGMAPGWGLAGDLISAAAQGYAGYATGGQAGLAKGLAGAAPAGHGGQYG